MNRHLPNGLFHALGTSRLTAGTVCDTCADVGWETTLGAGRLHRSGRGSPSPS